MRVDGVKLYRDIRIGGEVYTGSKDRRRRGISYILELFPAGWFAGKMVLDIGCAGGAICFAAADKGAPVAMGIDVDATRIHAAKRIARKNLIANVFFKNANVNDIELPHIYDCIFLLNVLHHEKDPRILMGRCARAAKEFVCIEHPKRGYFSTNNAHADAEQTHVMNWKDVCYFMEDNGCTLDRSVKSNVPHTKGSRYVGLFKRI